MCKALKREIRPLDPSDLEDVKRIESSAFPEPWDFEIFEILASYHGRAMKRGGEKLYMYVLEEDVVTGYVVWEESANEGHILNLAVREDKRNSGRGKGLLLFALRRQDLSGMTSCILECRDNNTIARRFYESIGMTEVGRVVGYYGNQDAIIYRWDF